MRVGADVRAARSLAPPALHPESSIYNAGEYLEIRGDLDVEVFEAALRRVIGELTHSPTVLR